MDLTYIESRLKQSIFSEFKKYYLLFIFYAISSATLFSQATGDLIINVQGIRNQKGKIRVSVYNNPDGFPSITEKAKFKAEGDIQNKESKVVLRDVPFGNYAISLIHDENNNFKVETNFIGIPKEGIGMSNDAKGLMGPPSFEQAKFKFFKDKQMVKINMLYY